MNIRIKYSDGYFENKIFKLSQARDLTRQVDDDSSVVKYNNFLLDSQHFLNMYRICADEEISIGNVEKFLNEYEIILKVFLVGYVSFDVYLIVRIDHRISDIRSLLEKLISFDNEVDIWSCGGQSLSDETILRDIDDGGDFRIIVSFKQQGNRTFEECVLFHDKVTLDVHLSADKWKLCKFHDQIVDRPNIRKEIKNFGEFLLQILTDTVLLDIDLSEIPTSYKNSRLFFATHTTNRILASLQLYLEQFKDIFGRKYEENLTSFNTSESVDGCNVFDIFDAYLKYSLLVSVFDYLHERGTASNYEDRIVKDIALRAIDYLIDPRLDGRDLVKKFVNYTLVKPYTEVEIHTFLFNSDPSHEIINIEFFGSDPRQALVANPIGTVLNVKESIAWQTGLTVEDFYVISDDENQQPVDLEEFNINNFRIFIHDD